MNSLGLEIGTSPAQSPSAVYSKIFVQCNRPIHSEGYHLFRSISTPSFSLWNPCLFPFMPLGDFSTSNSQGQTKFG